MAASRATEQICGFRHVAASISVEPIPTPSLQEAGYTHYIGGQSSPALPTGRPYSRHRPSVDERAA